MAVIEGVEVIIVVDGEPLKEYHDHELEDEPKTATRYVEAESGKNFEVHIKLSNGFRFKTRTIGAEIYVDGKSAHTPLISKKNSTETRVSESQSLSRGKMSKYMFNAVETVTDGYVKNGEAGVVKDLGSIVVKVDHCKKLGSRRVQKAGSIKPIDNVGILSEKALKGQSVSHSVGLGPASEAKGSGKVLTHSAKIVQKGVVFIFKYRSLAALKSMMIIPRSPTPPPLEHRDVNSLNQDELRELQKQFREMKAKETAAVKIKREKTDDNPRPRKIARPNRDSTQLELDDEGRARQSSTPTVAVDPEVIELD